MKIQIKSRYTSNVLYEVDAENVKVVSEWIEEFCKTENITLPTRVVTWG